MTINVNAYQPVSYKSMSPTSLVDHVIIYASDEVLIQEIFPRMSQDQIYYATKVLTSHKLEILNNYLSKNQANNCKTKK
jgi:hypothetical protein